MSDTFVRLKVGGVLFEVEKEILLRVRGTYFEPIASGAWRPDADGAYLIDKPATGFERILEYFSSGTLSLEGLTRMEKECMYSNLDFFLIPYRQQWKYDIHSQIEGFGAHSICELSDGRLCGAYRNGFIVWNMNTSAIEWLIKGHTSNIDQMIQLHDGRVCSCSHDKTIKLWSIGSKQCDLTINHTFRAVCMIQLVDGRLCSSSADNLIKVWNISTGVCEMSINPYNVHHSLVQLPDGRICGGGGTFGYISIYSLLTGKRELSWKGHTDCIYAIVCIDATRVCSCSGQTDKTIKVWSTATGECERILEGHIEGVLSIVLMQDGRLCSASHSFSDVSRTYVGTLMLWNVETGECVKTLPTQESTGYCNVMQLSDGRLVSCDSHSRVRIWN